MIFSNSWPFFNYFSQMVVCCFDVGRCCSVCRQHRSPADRLGVSQIASQFQHHLHIKACAGSVSLTGLDCYQNLALSVTSFVTSVVAGVNALNLKL